MYAKVSENALLARGVVVNSNLHYACQALGGSDDFVYVKRRSKFIAGKLDEVSLLFVSVASH